MAFAEHTVNGVVFRAAPALEAAGGAVHGFSTRAGGVSTGCWASLNLGVSRGDDPAHVRENYRRFCAAVGADCASVVLANQVHGDKVRVVTSADCAQGLYGHRAYEADGLITDVPGAALVVFSADCIPVLLYDPVREVVAAAHAGWMGTALGIVTRAVEKMTSVYGCDPASILAAIGPGISQCCFETHADVPDAMTAALGAGAPDYVQTLGGGKYKVDLKGLNALRLRRAGLLPAHISIDPDCTVCHPEKYWSHRVHRDQRGSQAAVIQLKAAR